MSQSIPQRCKIEISVSGPSREYQSQGSAVTFVPLTIKRRHTRKLLIAPPGQEDAKVRSSFDLPMIRTIGKAFYWQKLLDSGEVANATDLARQLIAKYGEQDGGVRFPLESWLALSMIYDIRAIQELPEWKR